MTGLMVRQQTKKKKKCIDRFPSHVCVVIGDSGWKWSAYQSKLALRVFLQNKICCNKSQVGLEARPDKYIVAAHIY